MCIIYPYGLWACIRCSIAVRLLNSIPGQLSMHMRLAQSGSTRFRFRTITTARYYPATARVQKTYSTLLTQPGALRASPSFEPSFLSTRLSLVRPKEPCKSSIPDCVLLSIYTPAKPQEELEITFDRSSPIGQSNAIFGDLALLGLLGTRLVLLSDLHTRIKV